MKKLFIVFIFYSLLFSTGIAATYPSTHPSDATWKEFVSSSFSDEKFKLYIWAVDTTLYAEFSPTANKPFVCSSSFSIVQNNMQYDIRLYKSNGDTLCGDLYVSVVTEIEIDGKPVSETLDMSKPFDIYYSYDDDEPMTVPALTDPNIAATCPGKININGLTISGKKQVGSTVIITMDAENSCNETVYYRYSIHPDYGTTAYDGTQWASMTWTEYTTASSISYTFNKAGKYIIVVWAKNETSDSNSGVMMIGAAIDVSESGKEPEFPF